MPAAGPRTARLPKPSITVADAGLRAAQRRMALFTVCIPTAGAAAAAAMALVNGIGAMELALLAGMCLATSIGVEIGLHRGLAHGAFEMRPSVKITLAVLGSMAAQGSVLYWTAGHRRHHAHSDRGSDPHSPHIRNLHAADEPLQRLRGLWHAHIGWMMTDKVTNCTLFAKDILRDPALSRIHALYIPIVLAGLAIPAFIGGAVSGSWNGMLSGFLWGGLLRMCLVHHSTWSNASVGHVFGARPFATGDRSANNPWFALPTLGSSWQNNHHMFPASAYLAVQPGQIDPGGLIIRFFAAAGLIRNVKQPPSFETVAAMRLPVSPKHRHAPGR
jgi:stearoyl-CoA desaturase (delta-9 desaturase)